MTAPASRNYILTLASPLKLDTEDAACRLYRQPELWFSDDPNERRQAKRICKGLCPIRMECLQAALDANIQDGIWGGLSGRQRTDLRKKLRK